MMSVAVYVAVAIHVDDADHVSGNGNGDLHVNGLWIGRSCDIGLGAQWAC